ncbi:sulfonate transport system ATP-binding protein [Methylacidimicrobium cyclopophantes]|uniref:Sulfonate transport system ATP-binding protein n=1 Tax=Methylacidimicrobium cyclopophantes TaxID=1041766 RepID=A0A5E6MG59_9BACT|nr:ABC transporter ATP-binding protein [Methylacidimicrobium cyclopophantes]VVM07340.1 sulfonate transport system ATP-binding protein [Methylacidimicrobium cyclopophantes]
MRRVVALLDRVSKQYGSGENATWALRSVCLEIEQGEFVALVGPSGCGKSSLLHLLAGIDRPSQGRVVVLGQSLGELEERKLTELRLGRIGIVFQFFNLLPTLTAEENVELPGLLRGMAPKEARQRARALLEEVGLSHRGRHRPEQMSGGEMQRVAVARALLLEPALVLADEPTGNLDSEASQTVIELFRDLGRRHGATLVLATHSQEVAAASSRIVRMRDGQILGEEPVGRKP